jgi:hypothetical protein
MPTRPEALHPLAGHSFCVGISAELNFFAGLDKKKLWLKDTIFMVVYAFGGPIAVQDRYPAQHDQTSSHDVLLVAPLLKISLVGNLISNGKRQQLSIRKLLP